MSKKPKPAADERAQGNDADKDTGQDAGETAKVAARVLVASRYGKPDDVVELAAADAAAGHAAGELDTHPDAVAYARSIKKEQS